jgi:hypothetical protein
VGPGRAGANVSSREQTWLEEGATVGEPPRPAASGRGVGDVSGSQPGGAVSGFGEISTVKASNVLSRSI